MGGLLRQGHFLGSKLRNLRKRNGLTLEEVSARCVQRDASHAPSVSYLSMVENGKRVPSAAMLQVVAEVFGKDPKWFLDRTETQGSPLVTGTGRSSGTPAMPLEPAFLFSKELLQSALPELLAQTGTSGRQFARLLVRVFQETRQNEFPDIERAAESVGQRRMPLSLKDVMEILARLDLKLRWFDDGDAAGDGRMVRAHFTSPGLIHINRRLKAHEARLKYTLAFFIGHRLLHNGDGVVPPHSTIGAIDDRAEGSERGVSPRDILLAWRDFECSAFAAALLCPKQPFRQFLVREGHEIQACQQIGVTPAVMMRRMTSISPYRHWHFFDGYQPGYLRAVYRGNGIPLPWGNMSVVPDPCPHWAVFRLLREPAAAAATPVSQLSIMQVDEAPRLYCCHSLHTTDAAGKSHVLSVGVDLAPALAAQGLDAAAIIGSVADSCRHGDASGRLDPEAASAIRTVSHVLNIGWVARALERNATVICPRSSRCPRTTPCAQPAL